MKTKLFAYAWILFVYLVPFRIAVLTPTSSNTINLICMITTVIGTLAFIFMTSSDGNRPVEVSNNQSASHTKEYKNAA